MIGKKYIIYFVLVFFLVIYAIWGYIGFVQDKKEYLEKQNYTLQCTNMKKRLSAMILAKQKATVAMALILVNDKDLAKDILHKSIKKKYYAHLINSFKKDTLYKNIWIQILDKNLNSIYRSWSDKKDDSLADIRGDLQHVIRYKKIAYGICAGKYSLSINAVVPILKDGEVVGVLEVISHFNSISKQMKKFDVDSVVLLDEKYKTQLKHPFTNIFVDDYYVANFDAPKKLLQHLKKRGVKKHLGEICQVDNDYIRVTYPLSSLNGKVVGFYIMFKKTNTISKTALKFNTFKLFAFGMLVLMLFIGFVNIVMFYFMRKQKIYYKNIIDSSTNIVLVTDGKVVQDVNTRFFQYFYKYKTIDDFRVEYGCICDIFSAEEGYVQKEIEGIPWIEYLLAHNDKKYKAKIEYEGNISYFVVGVSLISKEKKHYSVILSDITNEEAYRIELEQLAITDVLTGIKNRRYFHTKIQEEISRVKRYKHHLSLVMFDIDHFKRVNDEHGHDVGDDVLVEYTKLISGMLREGDTFARVGGEEFMIILPHINKENAQAVAEKLRLSVENYKKVLPLTMSFGVVEYNDGDSVKEILKRVDEALYEAKETGRNKVVAH